MGLNGSFSLCSITRGYFGGICYSILQSSPCDSSVLQSQSLAQETTRLLALGALQSRNITLLHSWKNPVIPSASDLRCFLRSEMNTIGKKSKNAPMKSTAGGEIHHFQPEPCGKSMKLHYVYLRMCRWVSYKIFPKPSISWPTPIFELMFSWR